MTSLADAPPAWSSDDTVIAGLRLLLGASALFIIYLDPTEPDRYVALTYTTLILYVLYSALIYLLAVRRSPLMRYLHNRAHWIDVGWYTLLIALSSGTNSAC